MTKNELVNNIAAKTGLPRMACENVIDVFADEIKKCLINGDKLLLKGFMKFEVTERPAREGRNPQTDEVVLFPPVKSVKCKICKEIKDAVNMR